MTDEHGRTPERPLLAGRVGPPRAIPARMARNNNRIRFTDSAARTARLDGQMQLALAAFSDDVVLTDSVQGADPQLVLVFEALDERTDLAQVAQQLGLELLVEVESRVDPDADVELISHQAKDPQITACLHAVCLNQTAMTRLLSAWRSWRSNGTVAWGLAPLVGLFEHLRDVRRWGPEDRIRAIDWSAYFEGRVASATHAVELELWFRGSQSVRQAAVADLNRVIVASGGTVLGAAEQIEIGYLAIKAEVPDLLLRLLAAGEFSDVQLIRSSHVLFLRVQGQSLLHQAPDEAGSVPSRELPTGPARVLLLDCVPAANSEKLAGRVVVVDPDDLAQVTEATVELRRHGTWMASAIIWGDIAAGEAPLRRPIVARPVIVPSAASVNQVEEFPDAAFVPDEMRRVFAEQFPDGVDDGLTIVNLSLGDPAMPFDSIMSSWARTLDWLSYHYGVLVVVSAGNHPSLPLGSVSSDELLAAVGPLRSAAVLSAQHDNWSGRRILSPAESINSITVGALHADLTNSSPLGYVFDPHDGEPAISPVSGLGAGHRRAIKPDVAAPGGRVMFTSPPIAASEVSAAQSSRYGIAVASPSPGQVTHTAGTSPAAALISRKLSNLVDLAEEVAGPGLARHERSVAAKALLIHGARHPAGLAEGPLPLRHAVGYGAVERDLGEGCSRNEATVLFLGELGAREEQELEFPLPDGLGTRDLKRITATMAWLSPVNWRHRQYRQAQLTFAKPSGLAQIPPAVDVADVDANRGSSTVKHQTWELDRAVAAGFGSSFTVTVKCYEQAGGLHGARIPYAVALSLWVAPTIDVDVYAQVVQQIRPQVRLRPRD